MVNDVLLRPLGDLIVSCDHLREPVKETDRRAGPYPYYGASGIVDHVDSYRFDGDYLLIAEDGENLRTQQTPIAFLASGQFWVNNHAHVVQANQTSDTRYLMYAVRTVDVRAYLTGSTMPKLTAGNLLRITIPYRPLPEQRAIASVLSALDDKIESNRRMSATLEAIARALFKSWFVDFDPIRAKVEGRDPGLPAGIAALFPDSFEHSELGEFPKGWTIKTLSEVAEIRGGKQLPTVECRPHGTFSVFGANGVMGYTERITHAGFVIAFGRVGANCGSVHWTYDGAWINNNASSVVPVAWHEFVLQAMLRVDFAVMRTGSAQPFIPNAVLASSRIVCPQNDILDAFCRLAHPVRLRDRAAKAESGTLAALRDGLLPNLISGEVRVTDAVRLVGETA